MSIYIPCNADLEISRFLDILVDKSITQTIIPADKADKEVQG